MYVQILWCGLLIFIASTVATKDETTIFANSHQKLIVPNIVHQIYDYKAPTFFLYLSMLCVQRYIKPDKHYLIVNDEGEERKQNWAKWQTNITIGSWEYNLTTLIKEKKLEIKFLTFPVGPPGNSSKIAIYKEHRSDFVRMSVLETNGGIYLDSDAFAINNLKSLRIHNFSIGLDNVVADQMDLPKRCNNGVLVAAPHSLFLKYWTKQYENFDPKSFLHDSSVVPYRIATQHPDLVNIEMNRISPVSYGYQTVQAATGITCGIFVPPHSSSNINNSTTTTTKHMGHGTDGNKGAIWYPVWNTEKKEVCFENTTADSFMYAEISKKLVLHLTRSHLP